MASIGEQLKQARIEKKLTLEQAAHTTRVRIHYLQALEEDRRDLMPSDVQGRGFLRLYAGYLGLPVEPLLDQWMGRVTEETLPIPAPLEPAAVESGAVSREEPAPVSPVAGAVEEAMPPEEEEIAPAPKGRGKRSQPVQSDIPSVPPAIQSVEKFRQIGAILKKQREEMELTLEEAEQISHIRQYYLTALEEGRMDMLPSLAQARGILSNYAVLLNLHPEEILNRFADALQTRRMEIAGQGAEKNKKRSATAPRTRRRTGPLAFITPDLLIGGGLFILIFVFFIWGVSQIDLLKGNTPEGTTAPISDILLTAGTASGNQDNSGNPVETNSNGGEGVTTNGITPTIGPINNDPLQIYIISRQRVWLEVISDEKIVFSGRTTPGTAYSFSGTSEVKVTAGDAAALEISFNRQDLGTLGVSGQVVRLVFTPGQVMTATPQFTSTLAPTQAPTSTLQPSPTLATPTVTPYIP